jgi:hypothetical protein
MPETAVSPSVPILHDLRLRDAPWLGARELAYYFHRSTHVRFRRLYRLELIRLAPEYPEQIYRDLERGWQIDPSLAAALFGLPFPSPSEAEKAQQELSITELVDFIGDPTVVYQARRIREAYWIQVVRDLAGDARRGTPPEILTHRRRELLRLFNERSDLAWWLAHDPDHA